MADEAVTATPTDNTAPVETGSGDVAALVNDTPAATSAEPAAPVEPAAPAAPAEPEVPKAQKLPEWVEKELGRKNARLKEREAQIKDYEAKFAEAQAERERLMAMMEAMRRGTAPSAAPAAEPAPAPSAAAPAPAPAQPAMPTRGQFATQEDFESAVAAEADRRTAAASYASQLNTANDTGAKVYGDHWNTALANLRTFGGFDQDTMNGILATDDPAKVIYELGRDPETYNRVMEMSPTKRLAEMVKLSMTPPKPQKTVSDAPAPVEPVGNRGSSPTNTALDDNLSDDEWYRRRSAQKAARWAAKNGRAA